MCCLNCGYFRRFVCGYMIVEYFRSACELYFFLFGSVSQTAVRESFDFIPFHSYLFLSSKNKIMIIIDTHGETIPLICPIASVKIYISFFLSFFLSCLFVSKVAWWDCDTKALSENKLSKIYFPGIKIIFHSLLFCQCNILLSFYSFSATKTFYRKTSDQCKYLFPRQIF